MFSAGQIRARAKLLSHEMKLAERVAQARSDLGLPNTVFLTGSGFLTVDKLFVASPVITDGVAVPGQPLPPFNLPRLPLFSDRSPMEAPTAFHDAVLNDAKPDEAMFAPGQDEVAPIADPSTFDVSTPWGDMESAESMLAANTCDPSADEQRLQELEAALEANGNLRALGGRAAALAAELRAANHSELAKRAMSIAAAALTAAVFAPYSDPDEGAAAVAVQGFQVLIVEIQTQIEFFETYQASDPLRSCAILQAKLDLLRVNLTSDLVQLADISDAAERERLRSTWQQVLTLLYHLEIELAELIQEKNEPTDERLPSLAQLKQVLATFLAQ